VIHLVERLLPIRSYLSG